MHANHTLRLECFTVAKHDVRSLDFAVTRFVMILFTSTSLNVIDECRLFFIMPPSEKIETRRISLEIKVLNCIVCCTILTYVHNYANIVSIQYSYCGLSLLPVFIDVVNIDYFNCIHRRTPVFSKGRF